MAACNISNDDSSSSPSSPSMSQTSSQSKYEWEILEEKISNETVKNFIKNKMPPHKIYGSQKINCTFCDKSHKMKRTYYKCMVKPTTLVECPSKYKIDYCEVLNHANIYMHDDHSHELDDAYANENGLDDEIKTAIRTILQHNPTLFPKKIRIQLTMDKAKYKIEHLEIPPLSKLQSFIHRERTKIKPVSNKIEDVIKFITDHLYFPTILPNQPFFFNKLFNKSWGFCNS